MRLVRDNSNQVIQGVFEEVASAVLNYTAAYAALDVELDETVAGAYLYADGAHPVKVKFNGGTTEHVLPPRVLWYFPLAVTEFNAKSTQAADTGALYVWGGC